MGAAVNQFDERGNLRNYVDLMTIDLEVFVMCVLCWFYLGTAELSATKPCVKRFLAVRDYTEQSWNEERAASGVAAEQVPPAAQPAAAAASAEPVAPAVQPAAAAASGVEAQQVAPAAQPAATGWAAVSIPESFPDTLALGQWRSRDEIRAASAWFILVAELPESGKKKKAVDSDDDDSSAAADHLFGQDRRASWRFDAAAAQAAIDQKGGAAAAGLAAGAGESVWGVEEVPVARSPAAGAAGAAGAGAGAAGAGAGAGSVTPARRLGGAGALVSKRKRQPEQSEQEEETAWRRASERAAEWEKVFAGRAAAALANKRSRELEEPGSEGSGCGDTESYDNGQPPLGGREGSGSDSEGDEGEGGGEEDSEEEEEASEGETDEPEESEEGEEEVDDSEDQ